MMSVAEKALELACADAWPGKSQWMPLYLKKARQVLGVKGDLLEWDELKAINERLIQDIRRRTEGTDEFYIEFDTQVNPGKIEAIKIAIGLETIADMSQSLSIALCTHPLYARLVEYVKLNPAR